MTISSVQTTLTDTINNINSEIVNKYITTATLDTKIAELENGLAEGKVLKIDDGNKLIDTKFDDIANIIITNNKDTLFNLLYPVAYTNLLVHVSITYTQDLATIFPGTKWEPVFYDMNANYAYDKRTA